MSSLIKLGPPEIVKTFEAFYFKALSNIDFRSIYQKIGNIGPDDFLGFVVKAPAYPPLYILNQMQGLVVMGIVSNVKELTRRFASEEIMTPPVFLELYRDLFRPYTDVLPEKQHVKCFYTLLGKEMINLPPFATLGQEKTVKSLLMRESVQGHEKMLVAGFFSEEAMENLLGAYEKWHGKGLRFDFEDDLAGLSLKFPKESSPKYALNEYRMISELIKQLLIEWFPHLFEPGEVGLAFPDNTYTLMSIRLLFKNLPKLLVSLNSFIAQYHSVLDLCAKTLSEQLRSGLRFFDRTDTIS